MSRRKVFRKNRQKGGGNETRREDLRLADVQKFLELIRASREGRADSFHKLFCRLGEADVTTNIGRLRRVTDFLFTDYEDPKKKGSGFETLFVEIPGVGLKPTELADQLYDLFLGVQTQILQSRTAFQTAIKRSQNRRTVVWLGAPQTAAYHLLALAFSSNKEVFGEDIDVRVEVGTSEEMVRKLAVGGILNAVVAYHPVNSQHLLQEPFPTEQHSQGNKEIRHVRFRSFGYWFGMVLLCHPARALIIKTQKGNEEVSKDANEDYWDEIQSLRRTYFDPKHQTKGEVAKKALYDKLWPLDPQTIDFSVTPLISVPSYCQPTGLDELVAEVRFRAGVRIVQSFEEALALVRANQGVAITNEFYCTRDGITAFRLEPQEKFRRYLGVYYNTRKGLAEPALRVIRFLKDYVDSFGSHLRTTGKPPSYGNPEYDKWCDAYVAGYATGNFRSPKGWESVKAFPKQISTRTEPD